MEQPPLLRNGHGRENIWGEEQMALIPLAQDATTKRHNNFDLIKHYNRDKNIKPSRTYSQIFVSLNNSYSL
jgi:hypothetical protein